MLTELFSWWSARMTELLPASMTGLAERAPPGVVIETDAVGGLSASMRRGNRQQMLPLGAVARQSGRRQIVLRAPADAVLEKTHIMPTASRADMEQMLRHELGRITPFPAEAVYWDWRARPRADDRTRSEVRLTIVPKVKLAGILDTLDRIGIRPKLLAAGSGAAHLLPLRDDSAARARRHLAAKALVWASVLLGGVAVALPFALQAWDLHHVQSAIDALRPDVSRVEQIRRGIDASSAGQDIMTRERARIGDLSAILAEVTNVLPDDTYLTDFSLRQRQLAISGRSASAPNVITAMAADPTFRNAAFAAPVTRFGGSSLDLFSIRVDLAP